MSHDGSVQRNIGIRYGASDVITIFSLGVENERADTRLESSLGHY